GGMQPLALAGDAKAGFVEMAHASLRHERGDPRRDSLEFLGLPLAPGDDAVRAKRRCTEQVGHRLRDPILGNELLNVEINRHRSHARAVLSRRDHPLGERGSGLVAAVRAAINHRLMFGDLQSRLGQIEHLPLLDPRDHRNRQPGEAMATRFRLVPFDDIGLCDRLQRIAGVSGLSAARFARSAARAAGDARRLLHAVARWRLAAVGTVLVQLPPKVRDLLAQGRVLHPQNFNLALQRRNQVPNLGSENHPYLDSYFPIPRPKKSWPFTLFHEDCCQSDSPQLGSYNKNFSPRPSPYRPKRASPAAPSFSDYWDDVGRLPDFRKMGVEKLWLSSRPS